MSWLKPQILVEGIVVVRKKDGTIKNLTGMIGNLKRIHRRTLDIEIDGDVYAIPRYQCKLAKKKNG